MSNDYIDEGCDFFFSFQRNQGRNNDTEHWFLRIPNLLEYPDWLISVSVTGKSFQRKLIHFASFYFFTIIKNPALIKEIWIFFVKSVLVLPGIHCNFYYMI